jgi:hypothetical protein
VSAPRLLAQPPAKENPVPTTVRHHLWRFGFLVAAALILVGGPQHPRGRMSAMLAHPSWTPSHLLMLGGFLALLAGLVLYGRGVTLPERTRRWRRLAIAGTILQAAEMSVHTAAAVDHAHLVAGEPTPVLATHLWMSVWLCPLFGLTVAGFIAATARERTLGSPWIAWLGVLGVVAWGAASPLVISLRAGWATLLFPVVLLFALWMALAAAWPGRAAIATASGRAAARSALAA